MLSTELMKILMMFLKYSLLICIIFLFNISNKNYHTDVICDISSLFNRYIRYHHDILHILICIKTGLDKLKIEYHLYKIIAHTLNLFL